MKPLLIYYSNVFLTESQNTEENFEKLKKTATTFAKTHTLQDSIRHHKNGRQWGSKLSQSLIFPWSHTTYQQVHIKPFFWIFWKSDKNFRYNVTFLWQTARFFVSKFGTSLKLPVLWMLSSQYLAFQLFAFEKLEQQFCDSFKRFRHLNFLSGKTHQTKSFLLGELWDSKSKSHCCLEQSSHKNSWRNMGENTLAVTAIR